jgi:hypothetical protein
MDVFAELKQEIKTAEWLAQEAGRERDKATENEKIMKHKLDMWTILKR